jgi:MFS family permease
MPGEARSVVFLLASVFATTAAMALLDTVLGKLVFDITDSELALGLLGLAEFAPAALLVFVTGPVADRVDRRRLAASAQVVEALVIVGVAVYTSTTPTSTLPLFFLVIGYGTARAFVTPATRSLPADTVSGARLPWLTARQAATWQGALVFGPVLGGFLYVVAPWVPFAAAAVLVVIAAGLVLFVQVRPFERTPRPVDDGGVVGDEPDRERKGMREALEGLRFVRRQPVLLGAISLDLFAVLFGGAIALLPAIAEDRLGVGAVGLGWLRAASGIGAGAVALFLTVRPVSRRIGRTLLTVVGIFGIGTIVLGATTSFVVAFVALLVLSGADAVSVFIRSTLVPLITPADKRGRVLAVEGVFIGASNELGAFESGVVGQLLGPASAVALGGIGTLGVAALWWFCFPALRDVDHFPAAADDLVQLGPATNAVEPPRAAPGLLAPPAPDL